MHINDKKTSDLDKILEGTGPEGIGSYLTEYTLEDHDNVADFLSARIVETKQKKKDVIARAGLSEQYGYQILNGSKTTSDRDKIIGLCIAAGLDITCTNRALKLSGFSPLYSKIDRDAVIMIGINNGLCSVMDLNELLEKHGMNILNLGE